MLRVAVDVALLGRDVQRAAADGHGLVAAHDLPRRSRDVGAVELVEDRAAAAATAARAGVRVEPDPVEVGDRLGRRRVAQRDRPDLRVGERAQRRRLADGRERRRRRTSRTPSGSCRPSGSARSRTSGASAGSAPLLSAALVARVARGLVDELELAVAARRDHVHRRPVVVVGVHAQAGLLVVLGQRRPSTLRGDRPRAARRRLGDDVLGAGAAPGRSSRCRSAARAARRATGSCPRCAAPSSG